MTENDRQALNLLEKTTQYKMGLCSSEELVSWVQGVGYVYDNLPKEEKLPENDIVNRLRKRANIRLQIKDRKSVQEGKPDRIAQLLLEAARRIEDLEKECAIWVDLLEKACSY